MSQLIYKKMNEVMKEVGAIGKEQINSAQGFKFRGIDQFVNSLYPALCKHSVFMTTDIIQKSETIKDVTRHNGKQGVDKHVTLTVKYTFHAEDGSSVSSTIASEGLDSGDKATNKALSSALKYALIQTFSIPTTDMAEADLESPELGKPIAPITTKTDSEFTTTSQPKTTTRATFKKPSSNGNGSHGTNTVTNSDGWE